MHFVWFLPIQVPRWLILQSRMSFVGMVLRPLCRFHRLSSSVIKPTTFHTVVNLRQSASNKPYLFLNQTILNNSPTHVFRQQLSRRFHTSPRRNVPPFLLIVLKPVAKAASIISGRLVRLRVLYCCMWIDGDHRIWGHNLTLELQPNSGR